jgi:hypothetical protein
MGQGEPGTDVFPEPPLDARNTAHCPFCRTRVESHTPQLFPGLSPDGRLTQGDSILFSNLFPYGSYSARRLMIKAGVTVRHRKKFIKTTDSRHNHPIAENLVNRQFPVDQPNRIWCSDLSYLWTMQGWLYLAVVIDLFSCKVVGWALSHSLEASLATEALLRASVAENPPMA